MVILISILLTYSTMMHLSSNSLESLRGKLLVILVLVSIFTLLGNEQMIAGDISFLKYFLLLLNIPVFMFCYSYYLECRKKYD